MKRWGIILSVLLGLTMAGCSDDKPVEEESHLPLESNLTMLKPPLLSVDAGGAGTHVELGKYCWEEEDKTCNIEPNNPQELLIGLTSMTVEPGQQISFGFGFIETDPPYPRQLLEIDKIKLVQFYKSEESEVEVIGRNFTAPQEKGRYYYLAKLRWDGEISGEANYAFTYSVQ